MDILQYELAQHGQWSADLIVYCTVDILQYELAQHGQWSADLIVYCTVRWGAR